MLIIKQRVFLTCIASIFLAVTNPLYGQSTPEPYSVGLKFHEAFVMQHSYNMGHLANQRPWGIEADFCRQTTGNKMWQKVHNYPLIGYSFQYYHMDPQKPLGDSYSLIIYYGKKFLKSNRSFFSYRIGIGAGYMEKRFDLHHNYQNNLNSSRINYALNGRLNFNYKLNEKIDLTSGIGIMHYSNGAIKIPNLGINLPSIHLGVVYYPELRNRNPEAGKLDTFAFPLSIPKKIRFNGALSGGLKQMYTVGSKRWFSSTLSLYASSYISLKSQINAGTDLFYDKSDKAVLDTIINQPKLKYFRWGLFGGYEYMVGKVSLLIQFGAYIYDPLKLQKPVYQRVGLKYYFTTKVFANMNLKTHFGQADYVEWGLGVHL